MLAGKYFFNVSCLQFINSTGKGYAKVRHQTRVISILVAELFSGFVAG
jgi:hypothetical protein